MGTPVNGRAKNQSFFEWSATPTSGTIDVKLLGAKHKWRHSFLGLFSDKYIWGSLKVWIVNIIGPNISLDSKFLTNLNNWPINNFNLGVQLN